MVRWCGIIVLLAGSAGLIACRCNAPVTPPASTPARAAVAAPTAHLTYRPEGCSYDVSTPDVDDASLGAEGGPAQPPDHIHASFAFDPATGFAVNWRTDPATMASDLLIGTDRQQVLAATGPAEGVRLQRGHTLSYHGSQPGSTTRLHEVHVCGLAPSTGYFYKVGAPGAFSAVYSVTTAPAAGTDAPFRFGVSGDARDSLSTFAATQKGIHEAGVAFELFTGDAVLAGNDQRLWNAFFEATFPGGSIQYVLASTPFMVSNGNHEGLAVNYLAQFAMPEHAGATGPARGEDWYAFDYGNTHFVALNDTTADTATLDRETAWLDDHLSHVDRARTPWLIVYHHRPPYSCSVHGSDLALRRRWQPLYDKYSVDLVLNGHDHDYERSKPIRGLDAQGNAVVVASASREQLHAGTGTIYVVSAGAGAHLYPTKQDCPHTLVTERAYHYLIADVAGRRLSVKAYRLDGTVLDQFTLEK